MNLYIDTNIYLSFYHYTSEDLEELRKLIVLIENDRVALHLPRQTIDEFRRNRDGKISDAIQNFGKEKLTSQFPQICKQYEEYKQLRDIIKKYQETKSELLEKLTSDVVNENLKADEIIDTLFAKANKIERTNDILTSAKIRFDIGNPPGKKKSYGDAINWESLLKAVPNDHKLYFISDDNDFSSQVDEKEFCPFLEHEWEERKKGQILYFKRLSTFFKDKFPDINLATELEKELLISDLKYAGSYRSARRILSNLSLFSEFTDTELNDIVFATISNNQVYRIIEDEDINGYIRGFIEGK